MGMSKRLKRTISIVPFVENAAPLFDVPRNYDFEAIYARLFGNINVTTLFTTVLSEAPLQLVTRQELTLNGQTQVYSKPWYLAHKNFFRSQLGLILAPSAAAVASYPVEASVVFDNQIIDGIRPKDSNLRSAGLSLFQMKTSMGPTAGAFTGAGVSAPVGMFIDFNSNEIQEFADAKGLVTSPLFLQKRTWLQYNPASASSALKIVLPVGNYMRGVIFRTTNLGAPSDAVINNVILNSGTDVRLNTPWLDLRRANGLDYESLIVAVGSPTVVGFAVADLIESGASRSGVRATEAWDLTDPTVTSEASVTLNVNGGAGFQIDMEVIEYVKLT